MCVCIIATDLSVEKHHNNYNFTISHNIILPNFLLYENIYILYLQVESITLIHYIYIAEDLLCVRFIGNKLRA